MATSCRFASTDSIVETRFEKKPVEVLCIENGSDIIAKKEVNGRTVVLAINRRNFDGLPHEFAVWSIDSRGCAHTGEYSRDIAKASKTFEDRRG